MVVQVDKYKWRIMGQTTSLCNRFTLLEHFHLWQHNNQQRLMYFKPFAPQVDSVHSLVDFITNP